MEVDHSPRYKISSPISPSDVEKYSGYKGEICYEKVINFERCFSSRELHHCVMCGENGTGSNIPCQNKDVCKSCDVLIWHLIDKDIVFKFCKGCKIFLSLIDFDSKPESSKCSKCRNRGQKNYFERKSKAKSSPQIRFNTLSIDSYESGSTENESVESIQESQPHRKRGRYIIKDKLSFQVETQTPIVSVRNVFNTFGHQHTSQFNTQTVASVDVSEDSIFHTSRDPPDSSLALLPTPPLNTVGQEYTPCLYTDKNLLQSDHQSLTSESSIPLLALNRPPLAPRRENNYVRFEESSPPISFENICSPWDHQASREHVSRNGKENSSYHVMKSNRNNAMLMTPRTPVDFKIISNFGYFTNESELKYKILPSSYESEGTGLRVGTPVNCVIMKSPNFVSRQDFKTPVTRSDWEYNPNTNPLMQLALLTDSFNRTDDVNSL